MSDVRRNELRADLLSTTALNPWPGHISSPRLQMFNSHITQAPPVVGATNRRCFTGMEAKYGQYTFSVGVPHDAHIIKPIMRYPRMIGANAINENPETILIYEYEVKNEHGHPTGVMEVDYISCPTHHTLHQSFGYRYDYSPMHGEAPTSMSAGEHIAEGTELGRSPNIDPKTGNYRYGLETEVAMMSVPQIIEDGVVISESYCKRLVTTGLETQVVSWGKQKYPLNIYGDDQKYKPFPDIGDVVADHGILVALRDYDDDMAPVTMSRSALRMPDFKYDQGIYVEPGAKVVDIKVHHDARLRGAIRGKSMNTPVGMSDQVDKYLTAEKVFYQSILNEYNRLRSSRRDSLRISPKFHRLLVEAQAATASGDKQRMIRKYRNVPIDEWRVEITLEYPIYPTIGSKLTDSHGGKGVVCDIVPDDDMPIDAAGNRAEMMMDGLSTVKRMNVSRLIEQYVNACSRELTTRIRGMVERGESKEEINNLLLPYYQIINPKMIDLVSTKGMVTDSHLKEVIENGIYLWIPPDNEPEPMDVIRSLRKHYPPVFDQIEYRGMSGNKVKSALPILIGSMYIILLEKTGRNWAAVSSSKLSHFGIPAKLTSADRNAAPGRNQPIRFGESEARLFTAFVGGQATADIFDRTNNPAVRKVVVERLLREDKPTNIDTIVDRGQYPTGNGRILSLIRHFGSCAGWKFTQIDSNVK